MHAFLPRRVSTLVALVSVAVFLDPTGLPAQHAEIEPLAKAAQRFDVVGLKLGVPLKEEMQALKAHNPKMELKKNDVQFAQVPMPFTYGVTATAPGDQIFITLTLPPNPIVVTRVARAVTFTKETAPTQQVVVDSLIKKYGTPMIDTGPAQLSAYFRRLVWCYNPDGSPWKGEVQDSDIEFYTFSSGGKVDAAQYAPGDVVGRVAQAPAFLAGPSAKLRVVQARLQSGLALGIRSPDVVSKVTVIMGDGPLENAAFLVTHKMISEGVNAALKKQKADAEVNRPKF